MADYNRKSVHVRQSSSKDMAVVNTEIRLPLNKRSRKLEEIHESTEERKRSRKEVGV